MTIPSALAFMFPAGYVPWYALPDPGAAPTTITVTQTINMASDFIIDAGEILFADQGATRIASSWDMPYVTNNGVMWVQHSTSSVTGISSGNINVFTNNGTLNAFSANNDSTGVYFGSWGVMQNAGTVRAISYAGDATAFITWSSDAWGSNNESNNTGTIEAWSGLGNATAVHLQNAGNYLNTGTIVAMGMTNATAFETSGHNSILTNSGLIEAITDGTNASIAIHNSWATNMTVDNSGIIRGDYAVYAHLAYDDPTTINNEITGIIEGDISLDNTPSEITNGGVIVGDISTGSGVDIFDSINGTFTGILDLGQGNDVADMGSTNDTVFGGRGNDILRGHDGNDTLGGGANDDILEGGAGNDVLDGGTGNDVLDGGTGNDTLIGGAGADMLDGGVGFDTASYEGSVNRVSVNLLNGATLGHSSGDTFDSIEGLIGSQFGDDLRGNNIDNILFGEAGKDTLIGFTGDDELYGGAGRDILNGGDGADEIDGGGDIDQVRYNGSDVGVNVDLGAGTASGGHAEGDELSNIENLFGSNHGDTLRGDSGNNKIFGHTGDDMLSAGGGIDKLFGGAGADTFVLAGGEGRAFVMDFEDDIDQLDVTAYGFNNLAEVLQNLDQAGDHARLRVGEDVLLIFNTDMNDVVDDIVF